MKIAGIIAEYNPFHNGHEFHLKMTRERSDAVVAVMSGNFVQRAEPAIMSKFSRAKAAVDCGVDLVVELPVCWSIASAQRFAQGGISVLNSLGCVDLLSFGSESADIDKILLASSALDSSEVSDYIKNNISCGETFAAIREKAVENFYGKEVSSVLKSPNDILGIEYCRELLRIGSNIKPIAIKRKNAAHDGDGTNDGFASARMIRGLIGQGKDFSSLMPTASFDIIKNELESMNAPGKMANLERAVLLMLRQMKPSELKAVPDVSEGIENRIIDCAKNCSSLSELFDSVKTKRYTHSRIRRIVLSAFLGINDIPKSVPYVRVLAFNKTGAEILKIAKKSSSVPIIAKKSDLVRCGEEAKVLFSIETKSTEIYSLLTPKIQVAGADFTTKIYKKPD